MINKLSKFNVEMIEQHCYQIIINMLKQIKDLNHILIGVDQSVFNLIIFYKLLH